MVYISSRRGKRSMNNGIEEDFNVARCEWFTSHCYAQQHTFLAQLGRKSTAVRSSSFLYRNRVLERAECVIVWGLVFRYVSTALKRIRVRTSVLGQAFACSSVRRVHPGPVWAQAEFSFRRISSVRVLNSELTNSEWDRCE